MTELYGFLLNPFAKSVTSFFLQYIFTSFFLIHGMFIR